jgi:hypothetical protein
MSLTPGVYDFAIYQGTDVSKTFSGFPLDLSTCTAIQIDVRVKPGGTLLLAFDLSSGLSIGGTGNTALTWTITNAQTAALPTGYEPSYDVRLTDAAGLEEVYFGGRITITERVTTGAAT